MTWVLFLFQEAGTDGGKTQQQFEELLKSSTTVFVVRAKTVYAACTQLAFLFSIRIFKVPVFYQINV